MIAFGTSPSPCRFGKILLLYAVICSLVCRVSGQRQQVVTADIDHFWEAYDKITASADTAAQRQWLNTLFLDKASPGQKAMMAVRDYTATSYLDAIHQYPAFWNSVRANTSRAKTIAPEIMAGIDRLKVLYPALKPATIYFTVGALRSNGTTLDSMVLIGSELALAGPATDVTEISASFSHLKGYFATNPGAEIVFLNVHEFVHTQQKTTIGNTLLQQCVIEGVAEFLAVKALQRDSPNPPVQFGRANSAAVREAFTGEMYSPVFSNWLWGRPHTSFNIRDLGYYIGYAICEAYYERATDKALAIKTMIELDYTNEQALDKFVNDSHFFEEKVAVYRKAFERKRPFVTGIGPVRNHASGIDSQITQITLYFSEKMDSGFVNFEYGPMGETHVLPVTGFSGFSADGTTATLKVNLRPGATYQLMVGYGFRSAAGFPLKPYLIELTTRKESLGRESSVKSNNSHKAQD